MKKLTLYFLFLTTITYAQPKITWPGHKKAVIVLTYDDALKSQLDVAVPQLVSAKFKATFFLTGDINFITIPRWRAISKKGFELANHTLYHPCITSNDNPVASETYTPNTIVREIGAMNYLLFAVDGKTSRTYAYPCTETTVGGKSYVDTLRKAGLVKYARVGGDVEAVITDFKNLDPLQIPSYGVEDGATGGQLVAFVKRVQQSGGLGIYMVYGIGDDYLTTPATSHRELLEYLKNNMKDIWVATFQQAMDYVTAQLKQNKG